MRSSDFHLSHRFKVWFVWASICATLALTVHQYKKRTEYWERHVNNVMRPQRVTPQSLDQDLGLVFAKKRESEQSPEFLLIHFWATWCTPCRAEIPTLGALNERMGDRIKIVTISTDKNKEDILKFFGNIEPSFEVLWDSSQRAAQKWHVDRYPETFLLAVTKNTMLRFSGARDWSSDEAIDYLSRQVEEFS